MHATMVGICAINAWHERENSSSLISHTTGKLHGYISRTVTTLVTSQNVVDSQSR